ncbi:ferredoxin reductase family protein [Demequina zhanjiangensis]|uniref:Ferredoxin reductase family protein n=1 Tax=Demequina zhanjiangensis TaxID=3051659 RepID=A0ABT8G331_9MICO|nr:ferredoxin reductase family protein [Demequina sp. SYSU T00b26]MDN4473548.1 ferredoxin reductase family protein [Demequina sp. SYSU T00b26]
MTVTAQSPRAGAATQERRQPLAVPGAAMLDLPTPASADRRSRGADLLQASVWLAAVAGIAFMIQSGAFLDAGVWGWLSMISRALGIVAAVMMLAQLLLASRAPWIDRVIGHDKAIMLHTEYGVTSVVVMLLHVGTVAVVDAQLAGSNPASQLLAYWSYDWFMAWALVSLAAILVVLVTSFASARARIPYHRWHAVHLLSYVGIALAVPHQFLQGATFRSMGVAWYFWFVLWAGAGSAFLLWRVVKPILVNRRQRLRVDAVRRESDGSVTITLGGAAIPRMGAQAGQFINVAFGRAAFLKEMHPYSLSAAPGETLRITVKPLGDASSALVDLTPGTAAWIEGPLGIFTHEQRTGRDLLLVGAGIGVTPLRSLLEDAPAYGAISVVVRGRSREEVPLIDEIEHLSALRGARYAALLGGRGSTWGTKARPVTLVGAVARPGDTDLYICGPVAWGRQVEADARAAGIPAHAIHREEFAW